MRLTDLLRALLKTTDEFVSLSEEIRVIKAYLDIELARFEERLSINIDIPPQLMMVRIPSLIIQPLVENAIKHGISPAKLGGAIEISAKLVIDSKEGFPSSNKILCITVQDTGVGTNDIKTVCKDRQSGIGLSNIRERLNHYYGSSASLNISSLFGKGTIVEIKFPLATSTAYESRMFTDVERI
jgi:sensor histidine kinase YesM